MAMLAEPRQRKRYNLTPRGKALYEDDSRFGTKMLEKMGWSKGKGLGAKEDGMQDFIRVRMRNNNEGIGYEDRGDHWMQHGQDFNNLLQSLNGGDESKTVASQSLDNEDEARIGLADKQTKPNLEKLKKQISGISLEKKSKHSKSRLHYQKFTKGKDLVQYSEKDLANIFGKKVVETEQENGIYEQFTEITAERNEKFSDVNEEKESGEMAGVQTIKSAVSISDYFKQKMKAMKNNLQNNDALKNMGNGVGFENDFTKEMSAAVKKKCKKRKWDKDVLPQIENYGTSDVDKKKAKIKNISAIKTLENGRLLEDAVYETENVAFKTTKDKHKNYQKAVDMQNYENVSDGKKNKANRIKGKQLSLEAADSVGKDEPTENVANDNTPKKTKKAKKSAHKETELTSVNVSKQMLEDDQADKMKSLSITEELVQGVNDVSQPLKDPIQQKLGERENSSCSKKSKKPDSTSEKTHDRLLDEHTKWQEPLEKPCENKEIELVTDNTSKHSLVSEGDEMKTMSSSKESAQGVKEGLQPVKEHKLQKLGETKNAGSCGKLKKQRKLDDLLEKTLDNLFNEDSEGEEQPHKPSEIFDLPTLDDLIEKYNSLNVYTISEFCAEKFGNVALDQFKGATLTQYPGYSYTTAELQLNIRFLPKDEERITHLWNCRTTKYQNANPKAVFGNYRMKMIKAYKAKQEKLPRFHLKTLKRKNAFQPL